MINRVKSRLKQGAMSFAQCGEDLIVDFIFNSLNRSAPTFLDLGAHDPIKFSNTYLFYRKGSTGVCVEADPFLSKTISRVRKRDTVLNIGVTANTNATAKFFVMTSRSLNTFSDVEAQRLTNYSSQKVEQVIEVPCLSINTIMKRYLPHSVDFISIDVEGGDYEILEAFDFRAYRPVVFCVETLSYTEDKSEEKLTSIIDLMRSRNYFVFGDTYINTIFVDEYTWKQR